MIRLAKHADLTNQDQAYQNLLHRWNRRTPNGMHHYDLTAAETNANTITVPNRNQKATQ